MISTPINLGNQEDGPKPEIMHVNSQKYLMRYDMASDLLSGPSAEQFQSFMASESLNVSVAAGVHHYDNNCQIDENSTHALD